MGRPIATALASRKAQGFTMVEALVAMFLGVLLLFGVTQVFDGSREGARLQNAMASVQDGGRIATEFISRDVRSADFSGCLRDHTGLSNALTGGNYDASYHPYFNLANGAVYGYTATGTQAIGGKTVLSGTDTLRIVGSRPICDGVMNLGVELSTESDALTLAEACPTAIPNGTVLMVTNCFNGDIFIKTNGSGTNIEHTADTISGLGNSTANLSSLYGKDASILEPFVYTYFLADGSNGNPALYRREDGTNYELIPDVIDFQVRFGVLLDNKQQFLEPASVADPAAIMAVRTSVTVRSTELVDGKPITRTYTSTSNIRNRTVESEL
ncbi:PilW family protein [Halioxenophilus sp. WMMB6]|uniref:PilW family protein n=1 Tax=Halioxenophilus sp. WMMB6 TaxID=3073815 RepID=UPI00295F3631|nr:PilW family protein [Halioxenophilus sp. WMMB6]